MRRKSRLTVAAFGGGYAINKLSLATEEKIELDWLLAPHILRQRPRKRGDSDRDFFFVDAAGAEEEVAKAHKLEFIGRLDTDSTDGCAAVYRITDRRAAAEMIAVRLGQRRERLRWRVQNCSWWPSCRTR